MPLDTCRRNICHPIHDATKTFWPLELLPSYPNASRTDDTLLWTKQLPPETFATKTFATQDINFAIQDIFLPRHLPLDTFVTRYVNHPRFCWKWGNPHCFNLPPGFWPMGGLGISSVPHLTITSPLVNRSCSSR